MGERKIFLCRRLTELRFPNQMPETQGTSMRWMTMIQMSSELVKIAGTRVPNHEEDCSQRIEKYYAVRR